MSPLSTDKEYKARELEEQAEYDWYCYDKSTPSNKRFNVSVGRVIDKAYFLENPIKCVFQSAGCMHRFKTQDEMQKHRYKTHGA